MQWEALISWLFFCLIGLLQNSFLKWLLKAWYSIIHHHSCMCSQPGKRCQVAEYFLRQFWDVVASKRPMWWIKRGVRVKPLINSSLLSVEVGYFNCGSYHTILFFNILCSIIIVPCMHLQPFQRHQDFKTLSSNVQILSEIDLSLDQESQFPALTFVLIYILIAITTDSIFLPSSVS